MGILGKFVCEGKKMSSGLKIIMEKTLKCQSLNSFNSDELRFLHLVICKMYDFCLNIYILKESIINAGTRDNEVLGRKVPVEVWKIIYEACKSIGVEEHMLVENFSRGQLWLHLNAHPELLQGMSQFIFSRLGIKHFVKISSQNITDGNYLFNLGSVLPYRLILILKFCLFFWGNEHEETWVRFFTGKIFMLYLIITGHLLIQKTYMLQAASTDYCGPLEIICDDVRGYLGIHPIMTNDLKHIPSLDLLFIFNNNFY
ncbi:orf 18 [Ateline gammaherpesvirus 3]|uniref:Orf 18 n=1 Tax=Ateline herpesvirus 3 TaxID=85618 RepID=Q9YTP8_ATHV3|nr:orf 18 [Ateline gammaherpesvirus 3]AAC95542.1 orf 18 [Ateline gammaherpesvirus 3]